MSNSTWPEGAMNDALEMIKIGIEPMKIVKFLQVKFPSYEFKHSAVKSFLYRWRRRGNSPPRAYKWTQEVSARAVALVREGLSLVETTRELNKDFPQIKFYKNDVINHMYHVRRSTGDKTLCFPGKAPVNTEVKDRIRNLVKNTNMNSREIAAELGITKGAVCGLLWRMREKTGDETLRARGKPPEWKPRERGSRNNGTVVKAATAAVDRRTKWNSEVVRIGPQYKRELKAQRRIAMINMMDYPQTVHIIDRVECTHYAGAAMGLPIIKYAQCPWPLWEDGTPFSEQFMCGNPKEEHGQYCKAHMCLAHDVRLPGQFAKRPGFVNKWTMSTGRAA